MGENFGELGEDMMEEDLVKMEVGEVLEGEGFVVRGKYGYKIWREILLKMVE